MGLIPHWDTEKSSNFSHVKHRIKNMTGTIKTLTERGFGFIAREGEAKDLFFHSKDLVGITFDALKVGQAVNFEVTQGEKGPAATNVTLVA